MPHFSGSGEYVGRAGRGSKARKAMNEETTRLRKKERAEMRRLAREKARKKSARHKTLLESR